MPRTPINHETVVAKANHILLHSMDSYKAERQGICYFLESLLLDAGKYKGFTYLNSGHMQESINGTSVGITRVDGENVFPDETRRVFFYR